MSHSDGPPHRSADPSSSLAPAWNAADRSGGTRSPLNGAASPDNESTEETGNVPPTSEDATYDANRTSRTAATESESDVIHRTPGKDTSDDDEIDSRAPKTISVSASAERNGNIDAFPKDLVGDDVLSSFDLADDAESESARLKALYRYNILDTDSERAFDHVAQMAAYLFNAPIAAVSLIDQDRQWLKACIGLEASEISLNNSFCARAIQSPGVMVVEDTANVAEFACMDVVEQAPNIRFYVGAPLTTTDGDRLGTLCVLDTAPRQRPDEKQLQHLENLASIVVDELELRRETVRRRQQTQELRQTAQRAEIARASAENARKRAEQAQRRAEEASASKSRFLTGMAHDIRSPISAIDGFAQLLQRTNDGPPKRHAERILQATAHLRDMADTLSELAELESGSMNLDAEDVNLCPVIRDTVTALQGRANGANITLDAITPDTSTYAFANPQALRRVIDNLAGNAIKYCEE